MPTGSGLPKALRRTLANRHGDPTVAEKMQRIAVIINISLERPNRHPSPTKAPGSPLGGTEASPRRIGQHTWGRSSGRSRASSIPRIIQGTRNEHASRKRRANEPKLGTSAN